MTARQLDTESEREVQKALENLKRSIEIFKPEMVELVFLREDSSLISPEALALAD